MGGLLLLDVDGPLNPYAAKAERRPPGYETFRLTQNGHWLIGKQAKKRKGMRVWLRPGHGELLHQLAADTGLTLVWATTWLHEANDRIGPAIGLRRLPVIEFETGTEQWKWQSVAAYAADQPLAWLDDEFDDPRFAAARTAFERQRAGTPTLLCSVDPRHGLTRTHFAAIRDWAATLVTAPPR